MSLWAQGATWGLSFVAPRGGSWLPGMLFPNVPLQCAILMICVKETTWNAVRSLSLMANAFQYGVI